MAPTDDGVSRELGSLGSDIRGIRDDLGELRSNYARLLALVERVIALEVRDRSNSHRIGRLERIVIGVVGFVFIGVGTAILALVLKK